MARRDWPTNLKCRDGYYSWFNPSDGREYGLGRDKRAAFQQATEANLHLDGMRDKRRLIDRITGADKTTFQAWCERYEADLAKKLEDGKVAKSSHDGARQKVRTVTKRWGGMRIEHVTTKDVADLLREYEEAGKERMAQAMRSLLMDVFNGAVAAGWISANPVSVTKGITVEVERARLTLEDFQRIHAIALRGHPARVARSMELALITGQRRDDLIRIGPRDVYDSHLWVVQGKGGNRVSIPTSIRLQAVNWSLSDVIERCRDNVLSRHFLHHISHVGRAKPGDAIRKQTVSAEFAECRDKAGVTGSAGKTPPTFHEIRSLAARLWSKERGDDFAKMLLGHKSADMAALYRDKRGDEWISVPG